jgi:cell volume regulation protein A
MGDGRLILVAGALLTAGLVMSLVATRVRLPALLLFLGIGMAIGSDGTDWIDFGAQRDDFEIARTAGVIALALILFEGGLTSGLLEVRPVLPTAISLAVPGTIVTALICGLAASWLFDLTTLEGLLLGSILASTDGAATFAVLRASTLRRRIARTLEAESGLNDPVAVLLVLGFIAWIEEPAYGIEDMLLLFAQQLGIGLLVGVAVGWLAVAAFRRARLDSAGLYPVASLAAGAVAFGAADTLEGSGFLAVYLAGLALGSASIPAKLTVTAFHQGLAWVAQMGLFFVLGLLVFPSRLPEAALEGTVLAFVILFVARPVATVLATQVGRVPLRERAVLSAAGLRGAVPVVLATFPVIEGVPGSRGFFDAVFFAVLLSTVLQAPAIEPLARALGATTAEPALPRPLAEAGTIRRLGAEVLEHEIRPGDAIAGNHVRDLGLPRDAVVNVIVRGDQAIPPRGSTILRAGDRLHILLREESSNEVRALTDRWTVGPVGPPPRPRPSAGRSPVFSVRPLRDGVVEGEVARPTAVAGHGAVSQLRIRRDIPGALVVLDDGRYAVTGPLVAIGARESLREWSERRLRSLPPDAEERAWLQNVNGALATDLPA